MARRRRVRRRKTGQKLFFLILLIAAVVVGYLVYDAYFKDKIRVDDDVEKIVEEKNESVVIEENKSETIEVDKKAEEDNTNDVKKENGIEVIDESDPNNSSDVTGYLYGEIKNDYFRIVVVTDQALSEGSCKVELSGVSSYTATAEIVAHPNSSSCVFKFDKDEILDGKYMAKITVTTTNSRSGVITGEVEK